MKNAIIAVALVLCFAVAADKIYRAYEATQPPAEAGECLIVTGPDNEQIGLTVVENNKEKKTSSVVLVVDTPLGVKMNISIQDVPYSELRQYPYRKVNCNEIR